MTTKLHAPRRRREAVRRPRLNERLSSSALPALTVLSAPTGFGKSTLLADCLAEPAGAAVAWLALDATDNDPAAFGAYLTAALDPLLPQPQGGRVPEPLLASAAALVNELDAVDGQVVLILDDYHVIESAEIHEAVTFLVDHASPRFHLVVATRADPPLPLARLRAQGDLLEIRAADLRFTADEAARFMNDSMGLHLTSTHIDALENRTEGWIAALQLAALSLQGRDDVAAFIENFAGDDRFVVDYLAEEVLDRQPESIRGFLLDTAVLDRFCGSLCDALTGLSDGKSTLATLDRANLFLVALDDRREWYRYHHLFADVLRVRLLDEQPDRIADLHLRASTWFSEHGEHAEAIEHALAGRHFELAAQLIELSAPTVRARRHDTTFRRWLEALPDDLFDDRPVLTMWLVGARMATGDRTGVERLLDRLDRSRDDAAPLSIVFDSDEYARLPAQIAVYRAGVALLSGDTTGAIEHATRALALVDPADHLRIGAASALVGLARWSTGELEKAHRHYSVAVDSFEQADFLPDLLGLLLARADIEIAQGHLGEARRTYETALERAAAHPGVRGAADMHVGLGELFIEFDDLDAAEHQLRISAELGERAGLPQHPYRWRVAAARLRTARGDLTGALELLEEAERVYNTDFSPPVRPVGAVAARVRLRQGDVTAAARWATDRGVGPDDSLTYVREYEHITLARLLLSEDDDDGGVCAALLDRLLDAARNGRRTGSVIELLGLIAVGRQRRDDRLGATAALDEALTLAAPEGSQRVFLDAGPELVKLLSSMDLSPPAQRHARRVLAGLTTAAPVSPTGQRGRLVVELSDRELDVLRLLRSELSGPEIARELHVSLNTFRTHTKNIYTKLGATNRREAIRRAGEHGL